MLNCDCCGKLINRQVFCNNACKQKKYRQPLRIVTPPLPIVTKISQKSQKPLPIVTESEKICSHGVLLGVGICRYGCKICK